MINDKKKNVWSIIGAFLFALIVIGATYAYLAAEHGTGKEVDINTTTGTTDSLKFEVEKDIEIEASLENFSEGDGNVSDGTSATATLKANNSTNHAKYGYNVYFNVTQNEFTYTTTNKNAELLLQVTLPTGETLKSIEGLNYVTSGGVSGFDITEMQGLITIASNYEIETRDEKIDEWHIDLVLVNLNSDQSANVGKEYTGQVLIQKSEKQSTQATLMSKKSNEAIWKHTSTIDSIIIEANNINHTDAEYIYDMSSAQDNSIKAYLVKNSDNDYYTVYINSSNDIMANENMEKWFYNFTKVTLIEGLENIDTKNTTDINSLFQNCYVLTELDLSTFDTSNVTDMSYMFYDCSGLTSLDLSPLDTSNVTNMSDMFDGCSGLVAIDLSTFDTSKVTDMSDMFYQCRKLTNLNLSSFDTHNVTNMQYMFWGCRSLVAIDLSTFDTSNVTNMVGMFASGNSSDHASFTPSKTLVSIKFGEKWNTSNVINMSNMFWGCSGLVTLDISLFDTSNVTTMREMFYGCSGLTELDLSPLDTSNVTNMSEMFVDCSGLTSLDLSKFDTHNVTDISWMFNGCSGLTSLDLSKFDTSNVTDMSYMFYECNALNYLNLSGWNTSNVTNMSYMFRDCSSLTTLDLSGLDTGKVTNMEAMFSGCSGLTSLDMRNADFTKVTRYSYMFYRVPSNINIIVKDADAENFIKTKAGSWPSTGTVTIAG